MCIKALKNKPGIYSARLAKKHGSFFKAMKYILKKMRKEKNREATFVCSLSFKKENKKIINVEGRLNGKFQKRLLEKKMASDMIQFLFQIKKLHLDR